MGISFGTSGSENKSFTQSGTSPAKIEENLAKVGEFFPFPEFSIQTPPGSLDPLGYYKGGGQPSLRPPGTAGPQYSGPEDPQTVRYSDFISAYADDPQNKAQDVQRAMRNLGYQPGSDLTYDQWVQVHNEINKFGTPTSMNYAAQALQHAGIVRDRQVQQHGAANPVDQFGNPIPPPPQMSQQLLHAIETGTATGKSWDGEKWIDAVGNPDLIYDGPTDTVFYKGQPLTPEQYTQMMASGPGAGHQGQQLLKSIQNARLDVVGDPEDATRFIDSDVNLARRQLGDLPDWAYEGPDQVNVGMIDFQPTRELLQSMFDARTSTELEQLEYHHDQQVDAARARLAQMGVSGVAAEEYIRREVDDPHIRRVESIIDGAWAETVEQWYGIAERVKVQDKANELQQALFNAGIKQQDKEFLIQQATTRDIADLEAMLKADISEMDARTARQVEKSRAYIAALGLSIDEFVADQANQKDILRMLQQEGQFQQNFLLQAWTAEQAARLEAIKVAGDLGRFSGSVATGESGGFRVGLS